jgi:hypothetical protein
MLLDLEALRAKPVSTAPFPHLIVPFFLNGAHLRDVSDDFPDIGMPGLFPVEEVAYGPAFAQLIRDLDSEALRSILSDKFEIDLAGRPAMISIRARARARDGQIHRDSDFKLVSLLLYLNDSWPHEEGWLRMLRGPENIDDYASQVPPFDGHLVAFRCTPTAWHGHTSFTGERRSVMVNYCRDKASMTRQHMRHRLSAKVKKVKRFFGIGKIAAHAEHRLVIQELAQGAVQMKNNECDDAGTDNSQRQQHLKQNNTNHVLP